VEAKRRPFDWVKTDRKHLRSSLRRIASAVRNGWLDGDGLADRRAVLIAALDDLANQPDLTGLELVALLATYAAMQRANLDWQVAARRPAALTRSTAGSSASRTSTRSTAGSSASRTSTRSTDGQGVDQVDVEGLHQVDRRPGR